MHRMLLRVLALTIVWVSTSEASLPCNEIHRDLSVPCKCDVKPSTFLDQGIGVVMDCDKIIFSGDLPVLPVKAPIIEFRQRYAGHQTLPSEIFSRSQLPIQALDFSHNSLRRLSERLFSGVADTLREINIGYNLLGDNLNPIFATTELQNLKNLNKLDLSGNQIRGLEEGILRGCENLQELILDSNLMTEVPHQSLNGPRALGTLSLARNRIKLIKPNDFSAQRDLKKIILTGNDLTVVEGGSFSGMSKLREIRLSVNSISRLNSDVFTGADNLEILDLSQNYFTEYPYVTLNGLYRLKYLNLSSNLIKSVSNSNLGELNNLEMLDLSRNNINSIQPGTFLGLKKLRHLDMSVNSLRTIEDDAFEGLDNLEQLSLNDNNILLIPASALGRLPRLVYLDISYNRISALSRDILQSTAGELVYFNLARNVIREIPEGTFQDLKNLKILNLNGNLLSKVNGHTFLGLEDTLEYLHLGQNKIKSLSGPDLGLPKLVFLDFSGNAFTTLPWTQFTQLLNLRHFNLSHNNLVDSFESTFFHNFPTLTTLDLTNAGITSIHPDWFSQSINLLQLILSRNEIELITENAFKNLRNLTYLDLSKNQISNLRAGCLGGNPNLRTLLLNDNNLNAFKGEYFRSGRTEYKNSTQLEFLNVANNQISYLFPSSFKIHKRLKTIIAHDNKFTFFPADLIANLQHLETVDLSNNNLKGIEEMDYSRLPRLRELILRGNEIEGVSESAFHNSTQLQLLDLSKNRINRIGERTFEGLLRIEKLNLHDNLLEDLPDTIFERSRLQMLETIDLSKNKFVVSPLKALQKQYFFLSEVNLANNQIEDISSEDVTIVNIKKLDLSFNPLTKTSIANILEEPKTVRELNLAGVGIQEIKQLQMPFLQKLNVSFNNISVAHPTVFERCNFLEDLDLSHNNIKDLSDVQAWDSTKSLKRFDISGNLIEDVLTDHLKHLTSLKVLHMQNLPNVLKIEKNAFKTLGGLKELKAYNYPRLGYLDVQGILRNLPTLELLEIEMKDSSVASEKLARIMHPRLSHLGLYGEQINSVSSGTFAGLKAPRINLKLVNTSVTTLPQGLFFPLPRSSEITFDVTNSKISSLSPQFISMFEDHRNHVTLKGLDTNPIVCDCTAKSLRKWMNSNKMISVTCHNEAFMGLSLRDIPENELSCDPRKPTTESTSTTQPTTTRFTPIITKSYKKSTTESDVIWSFSPKTKKVTQKPPKIVTANSNSLNDDVLIIGIVGGVVAFIIILVIIICIIRLRMMNNQYPSNPVPAPYAPSSACLYSVKPGPPSLYMAPSYATLPPKVMTQSIDAASLKQYATMRPPTQMQSYHQNTLQNQSAYYIPYTPDEKIEYR
ncbi:hypothetical protein RUM44_005220 [Polyplax serrata]|uniref:Chaoptin n=1 Tax=Polyplax serrata TaxID=468196 RepID=A0ABR1AFY9_POLSC